MPIDVYLTHLLPAITLIVLLSLLFSYVVISFPSSYRILYCVDDAKIKDTELLLLNNSTLSVGLLRLLYIIM